MLLVSRPEVPAGWKVITVAIPDLAVVYETDRLFGDECDPHLALARSESREGPGLTCGTCGQPAQGNYSDGDGPVCDACIESSR